MTVVDVVLAGRVVVVVAPPAVVVVTPPDDDDELFDCGFTVVTVVDGFVVGDAP